MKKILSLALGMLLVALLPILTACGNQAIFDPGSFSFNHIHIFDGTEGHCIDIEKWWDNESGIEIKTVNGDGIFCSEGTYQLFESSKSCPYC